MPKCTDTFCPIDHICIDTAELAVMIDFFETVFGMSVITNEAHDDYSEDYENNGDDVVKAADAAADRMCAIFTELIKSL